VKQYHPANLLVTAIVLVTLSIAVAGCASGASAATSSTQDGATLLATRCSACHSSDLSAAPKMTSDQWDRIVGQMIQTGAELTSGERKVLVAYLAATYGSTTMNRSVASAFGTRAGTP
jgi:mono/diheme cytochrome c family protein